MAWPLSQSTTDVVIGGLIAAAGGFLALIWVRWRDSVADRRRFQSAVLIVLDELGANEVNIANLIGKAFGPLEFYDETFRAVELVLADRLRPADRQLLAEAYAPLRARWAAEDPGGSPVDRAGLHRMHLIVPNQELLPKALEKIKAARSALAHYVPASQTIRQAERVNPE